MFDILNKFFFFILYKKPEKTSMRIVHQKLKNIDIYLKERLNIKKKGLVLLTSRTGDTRRWDNTCLGQLH